MTLKRNEISRYLQHKISQILLLYTNKIKILGLGNGYVIMSQNSRYLSPLHRSEEGENRSKEKSITVIFVHLPSRVDLSGSSALKGSPVQGLIIPARKNCGEFSYSALTVHTWLPHGRNLTPL